MADPDRTDPADLIRQRSDLLGAALDTWEAEDGPFTETELAAAAQLLDQCSEDGLWPHPERHVTAACGQCRCRSRFGC